MARFFLSSSSAVRVNRSKAFSFFSYCDCGCTIPILLRRSFANSRHFEFSMEASPILCTYSSLVVGPALSEVTLQRSERTSWISFAFLTLPFLIYIAYFSVFFTIVSLTLLCCCHFLTSLFLCNNSKPFESSLYSLSFFFASNFRFFACNIYTCSLMYSSLGVITYKSSFNSFFYFSYESSFLSKTLCLYELGTTDYS